ncbi:hypothetical protein ACP6H1_27490 [Vibrio harveyi]|uniref:hypothetical protein n=1 Tax=Vibrio harveyi TaxID=669 RepID=UPI003CED6019
MNQLPNTKFAKLNHVITCLNRFLNEPLPSSLSADDYSILELGKKHNALNATLLFYAYVFCQPPEEQIEVLNNQEFLLKLHEQCPTERFLEELADGLTSFANSTFKEQLISFNALAVIQLVQTRSS